MVGCTKAYNWILYFILFYLPFFFFLSLFNAWSRCSSRCSVCWPPGSYNPNSWTTDNYVTHSTAQLSTWATLLCRICLPHKYSLTGLPEEPLSIHHNTPVVCCLLPYLEIYFQWHYCSALVYRHLFSMLCAFIYRHLRLAPAFSVWLLLYYLTPFGLPPHLLFLCYM